MKIQKITIIASLFFATNAVYANEIFEKNNHHDHQEHSNMSMIDESSENTVYVCPMHPDIITENPSSCPICGMNLEKVELEEE